VEVMGDEKLRVIAYELLVNLHEKMTVDWVYWDSARARMYVGNYGDPSDLQSKAARTKLL